MPSEANITTRSTGLPSCWAVAVPEATVRTSAAAPRRAGASQRAQRFMCAPLPGVPGKPTTPFAARECSEVQIVTRSGFRLRPDEAHAFVHLLERGRRGCAGLVGTAGEHRAKLRFVRTQLLVTLLDRGQQLDDRFGHVLLELPVALAVVARLDLGDRVAGGDGHDLDQVRDPGLLLRVVADLAAGVGHGGLE